MAKFKITGLTVTITGSMNGQPLPALEAVRDEIFFARTYDEDGCGLVLSPAQQVQTTIEHIARRYAATVENIREVGI